MLPPHFLSMSPEKGTISKGKGLLVFQSQHFSGRYSFIFRGIQATRPKSSWVRVTTQRWWISWNRKPAFPRSKPWTGPLEIGVGRSVLLSKQVTLQLLSLQHVCRKDGHVFYVDETLCGANAWKRIVAFVQRFLKKIGSNSLAKRGARHVEDSIYRSCKGTH